MSFILGIEDEKDHFILRGTRHGQEHPCEVFDEHNDRERDEKSGAEEDSRREKLLLGGKLDALVGAGKAPPRRRDDALAQGQRGRHQRQGERRVGRVRQGQPWPAQLFKGEIIITKEYRDSTI